MKRVNVKSLLHIIEILKKKVRQWKYYLPVINLIFFTSVICLAIICVMLACYPSGSKIKVPEYSKEVNSLRRNSLTSSLRGIRLIDYYEPVLSRNPFSPNRTVWTSSGGKEQLPHKENKNEDDRKDKPVISLGKPATRPVKIVLQGILVFGNTRKALIENPDKTGNKKPFVFVEEGEEIAGYRVKLIERDHVKFDWFGEEQIFVLRPPLQ
ncbi:MAG: hypothetical protein ACUBOA_14410 [Candidatus Loosdrechtia sp.]|uniref:hypothetical protein n=1 Tax=Candidatus Loosdrechtia sp. TaxID=3101272 RepID=UPI003A66B208|nr:MAG: hypothetical protein QY305_04205 [Candidatus Jettenia sp. AMX2]